MRTIEKLLIFIIILLVLLIGLGFLVGKTYVVEEKEGKKEISERGTQNRTIQKLVVKKEEGTPSQKPLPNPPNIIKGIYLTSWSGGSERVINRVIAKSKESGVNAVVMDIKDFSGRLAYKSDIPAVQKYGAYEEKIKDVNGVIKKFHENNIYVIARITVFQDPIFSSARPDLAIHDTRKVSSSSPPGVETLWQDNHNLSWIDPASDEAWNYIFAIAKDAAERGFDELNFDYVRFPSDGNLNNLRYLHFNEQIPMRNVLRRFFANLRQTLPDTKLSADVFGYTAIMYENDLGIGQVIEDAYEMFDYVSPMLYPSHYATTFLGLDNAAKHPYEVVQYSLNHAKKRLAVMATSTRERTVIRPWLQDFDLNGVPYTALMVKSEIRAAEETLGETYAGYMLWDPENTYTWEAIE